MDCPGWWARQRLRLFESWNVGSGVFGGEGVAVGAGDFVEEGAEGFDFFGLGGGEVLGFGGVVFEVVEFGGEGGVLA